MVGTLRFAHPTAPLARNDAVQGVSAALPAHIFKQQTRPSPSHLHPKAKGRQVALPPSKSSREETYFRLLIAVRSKDSLAMPAAPHQLEPAPPGLIAVTLVVPVALK